MYSLRQLDLHPRIIGALNKAGVRWVRDVLRLSAPDLQRLTNLSAGDVRHLLTSAALHCRPRRPLPVLRAEETGTTLSLGCPLLDGLLRGGLPVGGVTELSGESGAGKTQVALQLCLSAQYPARHGGLDSGAVFVCTEDAFPGKRLRQLIAEQPRLRPDVPAGVTAGRRFADHVYVEHAPDLASLRHCLRRRVALLLARRLVRFVAVDSVAALFRAELDPSQWAERSRELLALSAALRHLCRHYNPAVLCINQSFWVQRAPGAGLGVGQPSDGATEHATAGADGEPGRPRQRPAPAGRGLCASPAPSGTPRRRLEGGRPGTGGRPGPTRR
ncbi:DNA repair protein XRCC3 isoform X2 [Stigmatopora nigra]